MNAIAEEIAGRHARLREAMRAAGVDLYLIAASPRFPMGVHYASNYDLIGDGALVVLPLEGEPALYVSETWDLPRATELSPIRDVQSCDDLAMLAGTLLQKPRSAVTGVDAEPAAWLSRVSAKAGRNIADDASILNRVARRKSEYELDIVRSAAVMADEAFLRGYDVLAAGMPEYKFLAEMEFSMRRKGAIDNFGFFSSGTHQHAIGVATAKPIVQGDYLIFEITPAVVSRNYSAQLCKTMTLGPASDVLKEKYKILREAFETAVDFAKPGVTIGAITKAMDDVIGRYGYEEYCRPPYMRVRGHGFGLGGISLSQKSKMPLEPGMAMILHPNQYFPEAGYLALGEMVIVNDKGVEPLSALPREIYEKPLAA